MNLTFYITLGAIILAGIIFLIVAFKNAKPNPIELAEDLKAQEEFGKIFDEPMVKPSISAGGESIEYASSVVMKIGGLNTPPKFEDMSVKEIQQAVSEITGYWVKLDRYIEDYDEYKREILKAANKCLEQFEKTGECKEDTWNKTSQPIVNPDQSIGRGYRIETKPEPEFINMSASKISLYVLTKTGIDITKIDHIDDYSDYKEAIKWRANRALEGLPLELTEDEITETESQLLQEIDELCEEVNACEIGLDMCPGVSGKPVSKIHPAIPSFKNRNCTEICAYVVSITGIDPAQFHKEYVYDYDDYRDGIIETAIKLLTDFYEDPYIAEEMIFSELNTIEIADYVFEKTGIDIKLEANNWEYEPDYQKFKLKFIRLARNTIADSLEKAIDEFETSEAVKEDSNAFVGMKASEIIDYVLRVKGDNIARKVRDKYGYPEDYNDYLKYITEEAYTSLGNIPSNVKIKYTDGGPVTTENLDVKMEPGNEVTFLTPTNEIVINGSDVKVTVKESKVQEPKYKFAQRCWGTPIAEEPVYAADEIQVEKNDNKLHPDVEASLEKYQIHVERVLDNKLKEFEEIIDKVNKAKLLNKNNNMLNVLKTAEDIYIRCKDIGRMKSVTEEIDLARDEKIKAVKLQQYENAAKWRHTERNFLLLLMKLEGGDIEGLLSTQEIDNYLNELTEKELTLLTTSNNVVEPVQDAFDMYRDSQKENMQYYRPVGIKDEIVKIINLTEIYPSELTIPYNSISLEQLRRLHNLLAEYNVKTIYEQLNSLSRKQLEELLKSLENSLGLRD